MAKRIICKNEDGVQVEFNYSFEPFFLVSVDGIYTVSNNVVTSENTMVDGSTYQGFLLTCLLRGMTAALNKLEALQ